MNHHVPWGAWWFFSDYTPMHEVTPKVVAMAVSTVITMFRILLQRSFFISYELWVMSFILGTDDTDKHGFMSLCFRSLRLMRWRGFLFPCHPSRRMPRKAEDGFRAIRVIRAKIYMHVVIFRKNIAKIQPPPTAMSRFVSYCPELSLNVAFCLFLIKYIYKIVWWIR